MIDNGFQERLDRILEKRFSRESIIVDVIRAKYEKAGVRVSERQLGRIANLVTKSFDDGATSFSFEFDEKAIRRLNPSLPADFECDVKVTSKDFDAYLKKIERGVSKTVPKVVSESARILYKYVLKQRGARNAETLEIRTGFERRLQRFWKVPVERLDIFIDLNSQIGAEINSLDRPLAAKESDLVFEVITRLHAKACRVASEVMALIRSGYADGAMARWRTIHEASVVANFINENGKDVANRYLLHQHVDNLKAAKRYNEFQKRLGVKRIPLRTLKRMQIHVDRLVAKFGKEFGNEYGWAAVALKNPKPRFSSIEDATRLEHWRPYYKMASHNVHAGSRGLFFQLGLYDESTILLAGPSNSGFTDPAQNTALSLLQITSILLTRKPTIDMLAWASTLQMLAVDVANAFWAKQQVLDVRQRKIQENQLRLNKKKAQSSKIRKKEKSRK